MMMRPAQGPRPPAPRGVEDADPGGVGSAAAGPIAGFRTRREPIGEARLEALVLEVALALFALEALERVREVARLALARVALLARALDDRLGAFQVRLRVAEPRGEAPVVLAGSRLRAAELGLERLELRGVRAALRLPPRALGDLGLAVAEHQEDGVARPREIVRVREEELQGGGVAELGEAPVHQGHHLVQVVHAREPDRAGGGRRGVRRGAGRGRAPDRARAATIGGDARLLGRADEAVERNVVLARRQRGGRVDARGGQDVRVHPERRPPL